MRTVYFYFTPWTEAQAALPGHAMLVYTGPQTGDYFRWFASLWAAEPAADLVCIEQDVAIHDQVIPQFAACPQPWCSFGWLVGPGQHSYWWLGCTKFSAELQRNVNLSAVRGHTADICMQCTEFTPCHRHLDVILTAVGEHLGYERPCIHEPDVRHLRA